MLKNRLGAVLAAGLIAASTDSCVTSSQGISVVATRRVVRAADGFPLLTFQLTERGSEDPTQPRALLFYLQGSSCASALDAAELLAGANAMGIPVVITERRGVGEDGKVDEATCREFSTKGQRVSDHLQVIQAYLRNASAGMPVILVGGSEGGDIAAAVATREPRVSHLILLGTGGGWSQEEEIRYSLTQQGSYLGLHSPSELDRVLSEIRRSPEALTLWAGHPYRRWSSYLWDPPLPDLLRLTIPIFLAHGARDESVPVGSARAVREAFAKEGKQNLTYREYETADHAFFDPERKVSLAPRVELDLVSWLASHGIVTGTEARELERRVRKNHPELPSENQEQR